MEVKKVNYEQALQEYFALIESGGNKEGGRRFEVSYYDSEESRYVPVSTEMGFLHVGKEVVYLASFLRSEEVKFRPCRDGMVQIEVY